MSVTPVREALARLNAERLVKLAPHHGYALANPTARRLGNLYELSGALLDFVIERCESATSGAPLFRSQSPMAASYAEGLSDLIQNMAAAQPNRELGDNLQAICDRLFPARRCEPKVFPDLAEELELLSIIWARRDLSDLRRHLQHHHAARIARVDAISSALSEQTGEP
jgi:hypothetical protein